MKHIKTSFKFISLILCAAMLASLCACGSKAGSQSQVSAMNTVVTATAYGKNGKAGADAACGVFTAMETMLDPNNETSTGYALNNASGQSVVVPGQIVDMLNAALQVRKNGGNGLDFTVWPLVQLWGFDDGKFSKPTDDEIKAALDTLCFDDIKIDTFADSGTYTVTLPSGSGITFNAASRGCAANYAIQAMQAKGVTSGIVSMPGCVKTIGTKPDGSQWNVAIQDPDEPDSYVGYLSVGETAVSTSGAYAQSYTYSDGKAYGHIIDPATGYPAKTDLKSVTVVCPDGTLADCLSTALFIKGKQGAMSYWRQYGGFDMVLITKDNEIVCTSGLTEAFSLNSSSYKVGYSE